MNDDEQNAELEGELRALDKADLDIESASERIQRQTELVQEMERDGHDASLAVKLLATMKESLHAMIDHRALIVERIDHLRQRQR